MSFNNGNAAGERNISNIFDELFRDIVYEQSNTYMNYDDVMNNNFSAFSLNKIVLERDDVRVALWKINVHKGSKSHFIPGYLIVFVSQ